MNTQKSDLLRQLRDRSLPMLKFRKATAELAELMAKEMPSGPNPILIPILRAGLAILPPFQARFQEAPIGFIGIKRDELTASPALYYENIPHLKHDSTILLLDPMLATGGSADLALRRIKAKGGSHILLVTVIAAPEGLTLIQRHHPDVRIYSVAIDEKLDSKKYIVPGLGDFGDRFFGTI
jgi:uracil phosphoribosyltransferase